MSITSLTKVTVGEPHPSETVTLATFGAGTVPLHPARVTLVGQERTGGVLSMVRVIVCEQVAAFPQSSPALYVRTVVSIQPAVVTTSLTNVTTGLLQPSLTVTSATFGAGTAVLHPVNVILAGQVIVGTAESTVRVIDCAHVDVFPQSSVAMYVLMVVSVQLFIVTTSLTKLTIT